MKKIKFGYKMIAYFFVVVFLVVTIVAIQVRGRTINMLKEDLQITSQQTMEAAVNEFERYMKTLSLPIDLMCRRNELKKIDEAFEKDQQKAIKDALLGALKVIDHSERTYYATQSGKYIQAKLVISEESKKTGDYILDESTFLQDKQWYKDSLGLKARNTVFSNFTKPYVNDEGVEVITVSQDLKASEEHVGVVAMDVNIDAFKEYINKIKLMNTGYTVLLDSDGNIIVNNDSNKIINKSATELEMWNDMIADIEKFEADEENADKHAMSCRSFSLNGDDMYVTLIKEPITGWYLIGFLGNDENEANIGTINKILLASLVLGIALGIAVALVITISISKELKKLAKATEIMAKGDLTQKLEIKRNDEFGELENNFNKMMDSISELIKEVSDGASEISVVAESVYSESNTTKESVGQVTTAIGGVANGATKQAMSTAQAKEDVESLSDNLAVSKEKLTVISDKSKGTGELSKKGAQILEELTKKSEKAKNNAASSIEIMSEMVKSLDKINYISDAIADITSQTNLLSLNASIEAARAGEAGKGFAVVADEIRKLAEQSNQSTEEIKNILSEITQNSNNVDTSLKESGTIQEEQQESINETDQLFSQIDSSIKELLEAVNELEQLNIQMDKQRGNVVKSMEQVSEVSESTAAATEEVNASTEQVAQTMIKIADSTKELNDIVGKLDISINHFKF